MNKVILVGRLCNDLELRYVGERNTAVVKFTLAITRDYKNAQGKYDTDFIRCELWNKRAEAFYQYLKKGELVGVEGKLRLEKYTTADGEKRSAVIVRCDDFTFMPSSNRKEPDRKSVV